MTPEWLIAMRLADMVLVHPKMSREHVCSMCGERVGIYPSGQWVLGHHPQIKIVCHHCIPEADRFCPAPGWEAEIGQSILRTEE
jgi:hypothetical protein